VYDESFKEHISHLWYMLNVLRNEKLYANLKKCTFCIDKFVFLRYSVNKKGIEIDKEIVKKLHKSVQQYIEREKWTIYH